MRILLVEDDQSLSMAMAYKLKKERFELTACADGPSALEEARAQAFDLVLLDRMLPGLSGDEVLKAMRGEGMHMPILMVTAMDGVPDRVAGLDAGADDYLVKPFAMEELLARVRALLRRKPDWVPRDVLSAGDIVCDGERCELKCRDRVKTLSRREAELMMFLLRNPNQVLPRSVLLDRVWGDSIVEEGNLDIYIHFLRKHLTALKSQVIIETVRAVGYRLAARA